MKTAIITLALVAVNYTASAQIERKPAVISKADTAVISKVGEQTGKESRRDRVKDIDFTKEQKAKLIELRQANTATKAAIENNAALSEFEKKKQLRALQKDQAQKLQAILTPEQIEKFKAGRQNNP